MSVVPITAARAALPELVKRAQTQAVILSRRGKPAAVLVSIDAYQHMVQAVQDAEDAAAYDAATADPNPAIPWEQVKTDLGLL